METSQIHERIAARVGDGVVESSPEGKHPWIRVSPEVLLDLCRYLAEDPDLRFDALSNLSGVDYPADGDVEVVYHLFSFVHRHKLALKVRTPRDAAVLPSVVGVWRAADWHEREVFDLLGVTFTDHPNLRRIMMPEDWVGYPLRKDFVEPEEYHGISTRRESLIR